MNSNSILAIAQRTIALEASAIQNLQNFVDDSFIKAINSIATANGRVIITGIGKSAIIAQKIVATFNSTGTAAIYMHAADAIHGDLGMIQSKDVVIVISKSGDSPEIKVLTTLLKNFGNTLIGMVGNMQSFLATKSDIILNTTVDKEACPNNLAPTSSTTAQMVMGDALAVCLMEIKGFNSNDFAKYHPGGTLGKKLFLRVEDVVPQNAKPKVLPTSTIKEVIVEMTNKRLGATAVINEQEKILGIITDGDLRRMLEKGEDINTLTANSIMSINPQSIEQISLATEAMQQMQQKNISQLIIKKNEKYAGIIHLHDLIREGII
jgi:arabinose-5-phosphate isomerase